MKDRKEFEYLKLVKNVSKVKEQFQQIPFLNGGLFNEHEGDDFKISNDYFFSELQTRHIKELDGDYKVEGIIRILSKYQYKLSFDDLLDQSEYANTIDPEFVGKVFESLLACIDADSKESRRKITGSFYTPREIVSYMVNESLDSFLTAKNAEERGELQNESLRSSAPSAVHKLLSCKILDPACGSGAFPCGVMNEIMHRIDPDKTLSQTERYRKKLDILRNIIYGVDIQPMAVQIVILRLFLSLIQEIKPDKKKDNFGIEPLPNLETKFVCANTLIGLKHEKQGRLELLIVKTTIKMLQDTRNRYFLASGVLEKKQLREYDENLRKALGIALEDAGELSHETAELLAQWNPYDQTKSAEFFDPMWMFGIEKFDVVIGNPPYIQLQKNGGILAKQFENSGYETFARTGDIYCLFYERAWQLLPDNGICCFITSNKWMRAGYGKKLRDFLAKKTNPQLLLDFDGVKVFESATVDTSILLYRKEPNEGKCIAISPREEESDTSKSKLPFGIFVDRQTMNFNTSDAWVVLSPYERRIKKKIESVGKPLKEWDIAILRGVLTGYNEAFIIDGETKDKLIDEDAKSAAILKPLLRGRDIKRYGYDFAEQWLIATFPALSINIDDYPAVKKHLLSFGIKRLEQSGKRGSRKKTTHRWFEIQDSIQYYKEFEREKIVYRDIAQRLSFSIAEAGMYFNNTVYFIVPKQHIKYCLAVLNSSLIDWYYRTLSVQLGKSAVRLFNIYFENIPIPIPDSATERHFAALVERRLKGEDVDAEIDRLVYKLYGLTKEEREIVEGEK
jgi:type I restriction-modification system DNA methylase subunit